VVWRTSSAVWTSSANRHIAASSELVFGEAVFSYAGGRLASREAVSYAEGGVAIGSLVL
jgi:hypothetical protein